MSLGRALPHTSPMRRPVRPLAALRPWQIVPGVPLLTFYSFAVVSVRALLWLLTRCEVVGAERVPKTGPLVLVSNHLHFVDPPILNGTVGRKVLLMAKSEIFDVPVVGWIARHMDAFPVRRGEADRQALRDAQRALELGIAVGMFPEGTRSRDGVMGSAHPGAALIALRSGCPVLPVAIDNSESIFSSLRRGRRARVRVLFGEPFTITSDGASTDRLERITHQMMAHIATLLPAWRRGPYAEVHR